MGMRCSGWGAEKHGYITNRNNAVRLFSGMASWQEGTVEKMGVYCRINGTAILVLYDYQG